MNLSKLLVRLKAVYFIIVCLVILYYELHIVLAMVFIGGFNFKENLEIVDSELGAVEGLKDAFKGLKEGTE